MSTHDQWLMRSLLAWVAGALAAACAFDRPPDVPGDNVDGPGQDGSVDGSNADATPDALPDGPVEPSEFLSCIELSNSCGPGSNTSCCDSSQVPAGTFLRSYDAATDDFNDSGFAATVSSFRLDTYEVTVGRFRKFVEAGFGTQTSPPLEGSGAHPAIPGSGWQLTWNGQLASNTTALRSALKCATGLETWTDGAGNSESLPINCVTWYEAFAFCIWDGGRLPTEAEWNYAAAGGSAQRAYPWSSPASSTTIDCTYANYSSCAAAGPAPVGSLAPRGSARWGQADLSGNVMEWILDLHTPVYQTPCEDCAQLATGTERVIRGGAYNFGSIVLRTADRRIYSSPTLRGSNIGVRCARLP